MMTKKRNNYSVFIVPVVVIGLILYGVFLGIQRSLIVEDFKIAKAYIVDLGYHKGRFKAGGSYYFFVDGVKYTGEFARGHICGNIPEGQVPSSGDAKYLVAYKSSNPNVSDILLSLERFKRYNVKFTEEHQAALTPFFICDD